MTDPTWIIVLAKAASEELAEASLRRAGWRVYLPRYRRILRGVLLDPVTRKRRRTRGPGEIVLRPAIPGYLFAELHPRQEWRSILRIPGVLDLMRSLEDGRSLAHIRPQAIDALRADENAGLFDEPRCRRGHEAVTSRPDLEIGDQVQANIAGHMLQGTLQKLDKTDRAVVSYMLFGRETRAETSAGALELVGA